MASLSWTTFSQLGPAQYAGLSRISVAAKLKGAGLHFTTTVESSHEEGGLRLLRVALPGSLEYQHSRSEHRVEVGELQIPVRLFVGEGVIVRGMLQDLCPQGLGLRLAKVAGLKRGKAYRCSIDHSDEECVEVEVELTRAEKATGTLAVQVGAQLHNMSSHELWQWQRFVAEIERRLLRSH